MFVFTEELSLQFGDSRLGDVMCLHPPKVIQVFMENYLKAITEYEIAAKQSTSKVEIVESKITGCQYKIGDECECKEYERTGVACPHMILLAIRSSKLPKELISSRWCLSQPTNKETK